MGLLSFDAGGFAGVVSVASVVGINELLVAVRAVADRLAGDGAETVAAACDERGRVALGRHNRWLHASRLSSWLIRAGVSRLGFEPSWLILFMQVVPSWLSWLTLWRDRVIRLAGDLTGQMPRRCPREAL